MNEESDEASAQAIAVQQLGDEVRALRRLMLAILTLALVLLAAFSLDAFFSIPHVLKVFDATLPGRPLPTLTQFTIRLGDSPVLLGGLTIGPIASMLWLWLERTRPALPAFAMLCLCVLLTLFLVLIRLSLGLPLLSIVTGLGTSL
jgi:hypothetical protein